MATGDPTPTPTPTPGPTPPTPPTPPVAPTKTMAEAIAEYQAANPASVAAYGGIVPWLNERGYNVAYATHGVGGGERSNDAIVDSSGNTWDLLIGSSEANPRWMVGNSGAYDPTRMVIGASGTPQRFSDWQTSVGGTSTSTGAPPPPTKSEDFPRVPENPSDTGSHPPRGGPAPNPTQPQGGSSAMYAAAYAAQSRYRQRGTGQGRATTIGAGFGAGNPRISPATILGSR